MVNVAQQVVTQGQQPGQQKKNPPQQVAT